MAFKLYVLLENIRSTYNVGSIFRTCDAAGIDTLYLTGYTAYPPHPKLNKTALGSLSSVHWQYHKDALTIAQKLHNKNIELIAMESGKNAKSLFDVTITQDTCLVFGNETAGISPELIQVCDQILTIPQFGKKESLNVSVAAGISMYEFTRKNIKNNEN